MVELMGNDSCTPCSVCHVWRGTGIWHLALALGLRRRRLLFIAGGQRHGGQQMHQLLPAAEQRRQPPSISATGPFEDGHQTIAATVGIQEQREVLALPKTIPAHPTWMPTCRLGG